MVVHAFHPCLRREGRGRRMRTQEHLCLQNEFEATVPGTINQAKIPPQHMQSVPDLRRFEESKMYNYCLLM